MLSFPAYPLIPLVPSLVGSHPMLSNRLREHSTSLDPRLDYALATSRIQASAGFMNHAT